MAEAAYRDSFNGIRLSPAELTARGVGWMLLTQVATSVLPLADEQLIAGPFYKVNFLP